MKSVFKITVASTLLATLAGCADMYTKDGTPNDPLESVNRKVFIVNDTLDHYALKPAAEGYTAITSEPVREGVGNFFGNIGEVGNFANGVLQGNPLIAGASLSRFLINTTLGLGGILDPATSLGIERRSEDVGKTFAAWGARSGPFLMLPLLGPSTLRDTAGMPFDWYLDPVRQIDDNYKRWGLRFIDLLNIRSGLLDKEKLLQGDRYTLLRDAWMQSRQYQIKGPQAGDPFAVGDFDYDEPASKPARHDTGSQPVRP